jgi:hypothetical protein
MNKKKWALLVFVGLLIFGYIKLFYKTISATSVPKSADVIVAIDVKRVTNTLIWDFITTPSKWSLGSKKTSTVEAIGWMDMLKIPDYVFAFHVKGQPSYAWYTLLEVKDETVFDKGITQQHFVKKDNNIYLNLDLGIAIYKQAEKILVTGVATTTNENLDQVVQELFYKKLYTSKDLLSNIADAKSHLAIHFNANKYLQTPTIIAANFNNQKVEIHSALTPNKEFDFTESNFTFSPNSLCALGFTQPTTAVYNLLNDSAKANISRTLSINIDTLLQASNKFYELDLDGIKSRTDSAITYTYDDNFNKIEKAVVNKVEEPSFNFSIVGDSVKTIFNTWLHNSTFEETQAGNLFKPMPFVKSYCTVQNEKLLKITSANYAATKADKSSNCVFFINIELAKLPGSMLKYLPNNVAKAIANIESLGFLLKKENEKLLLEGSIIKKENKLPFITM